MKDYYSILGVPESATVQQIKERYKFLAQAYHPDKFSSEGHKANAETTFKEINEAYQTLSVPARRAAYDRNRIRNTQRPNAAGATPTAEGSSHSMYAWLNHPVVVRVLCFLLVLAISSVVGALQRCSRESWRAKETVDIRSSSHREFEIPEEMREGTATEVSIYAGSSVAGDSVEASEENGSGESSQVPFTISEAIWEEAERSQFLNKVRYRRKAIEGRKFPQQLHVYGEPLDVSGNALSDYQPLVNGVFVKTESITPGYITVTLKVAGGPKHLISIETWPAPDLNSDKGVWLAGVVQSTLSDIRYTGAKQKFGSE